MIWHGCRASRPGQPQSPKIVGWTASGRNGRQHARTNARQGGADAARSTPRGIQASTPAGYLNTGLPPICRKAARMPSARRSACSGSSCRRSRALPAPTRIVIFPSCATKPGSITRSTVSSYRAGASSCPAAGVAGACAAQCLVRAFFVAGAVMALAGGLGPMLSSACPASACAMVRRLRVSPRWWRRPDATLPASPRWLPSAWRRGLESCRLAPSCWRQRSLSAPPWGLRSAP